MNLSAHSCEEVVSLEQQLRSQILSSDDLARKDISNEFKRTGFDKLERAMNRYVKERGGGDRDLRPSLFIAVLTILAVLFACMRSQGTSLSCQREILSSYDNQALLKEMRQSVSDNSEELQRLRTRISGESELLAGLSAKMAQRFGKDGE
eukprot:TRINITY_DN20272_c0_g3_i1.p1 TRINITY_DN20272_c0_g3~~TRINITY_DN20272_c0_g3_i1.p1  ORF type:complete len:165 (+),score=22.86 TRINITY_DN20272_c0_g3_i1:46-495(+)